MKTDLIKESLIILASSSPRRLDVLRANAIEPVIMPPLGEEVFPVGLTPEKAVMELALQKATSVADKAKDLYGHQDYIIIGADTVVFLDEIIGKPKDRKHAFDILSKLRGREHYVATGVALLKSTFATRKTSSEASKEVSRVFYELTKVAFKNYSDEDIERYISTDEPYDKAGGYAIQGGFAPYIGYIEGDYDNVVGFPWTRIKREIEKLGTSIKLNRIHD